MSEAAVQEQVCPSSGLAVLRAGSWIVSHFRQRFGIQTHVQPLPTKPAAPSTPPHTNSAPLSNRRQHCCTMPQILSHPLFARLVEEASRRAQEMSDAELTGVWLMRVNHGAAFDKLPGALPPRPVLRCHAGLGAALCTAAAASPGHPAQPECCTEPPLQWASLLYPSLPPHTEIGSACASLRYDQSALVEQVCA